MTVVILAGDGRYSRAWELDFESIKNSSHYENYPKPTDMASDIVSVHVKYK